MYLFARRYYGRNIFNNRDDDRWWWRWVLVLGKMWCCFRFWFWWCWSVLLCGVAFVFVLLLCLCCCCMLLVLGSWFSVLVGVAPVLGFGFWIFFFVAGSWKFKFASSRQKDGSCKRIFHCFQKEVKEKRKERNGGNEESGRNPSRFYRGICKNIPSIIHNT